MELFSIFLFFWFQVKTLFYSLSCSWKLAAIKRFCVFGLSIYSANIHVDLKTAIYNLYIMHKWHVNVIPPHANNDYRILIAVIENSVFEPGFNEWFLDFYHTLIRDVKVLQFFPQKMMKNAFHEKYILAKFK